MIVLSVFYSNSCSTLGMKALPYGFCLFARLTGDVHWGTVGSCPMGMCFLKDVSFEYALSSCYIIRHT